MTQFTRTVEGFIPPSILLDLARRNPTLVGLTKSLFLTQKLWNESAARQGNLFRFVGSDKHGERYIYNAENKPSRPGKLVRSEGQGPVGDTTVDNGYDFHGFVRDFYMKRHGRNSIDANGMPLKGIVHFDQDFLNAYWDGQYMTYGDGDNVIFITFMLLNVAAHELRHGITEYQVPGGIEYYGMAGAINEHLSDVSGASVESWTMNDGKGIDALGYHWLVGKGIWVPAPAGSKAIRRGLRDMRNPGTAYNDPKLGKDRQPDHMSKYVRTSSDNGGVHTNSGIPNRAFNLFAEGIQKALGGNDWESTVGLAEDVWYAAVPDLGNTPSFGQLAYHTIQACAIHGDIEKKLVPVLKGAWDGVGVTPDKNATDNLTPVADDNSGIVIES